MSISALEVFLRKGDNSRSRESLTIFKLHYDLKLAAAVRDYDLSVYTPDVDRDGFDVILDDQSSIKKIQVKTLLKSAETYYWQIHKSIIRPNKETCERLGFESSPSGTGVQGGVVLMKLDPSEASIDVKYLYTDVFVITALWLNIVRKRPSIQPNVFDVFYRDIQKGLSNEKIRLPKSLFVEAKTPEHLLSLMGMHSRVESMWQYNLLKVGEREFPNPREDVCSEMPVEKRKEIVAEGLLELTNNLVASHG